MGKIGKYFIPSSINDFRPRALEKRPVIFYFVVFLIGEILFLSLTVVLPGTNYFADISSTAVIDLVNQKRETSGIGKLGINDELNQAAAAKANDMIAKGYFDHYAPDGTSPWYWFGKSSYDYVYAGENLAKGFVDANSVFNAWLRSDSHRANILNPHYTEIGVAVVSGNIKGQDTTLVVQMFGSRAKESSRSVTAPASVPAAPKAKKLTQAVISDFAEPLGRNLFLLGLAFIFLLFVWNVFIEIRVQHRDLIFNSLIMMAFMLGAFLLNGHIIGANLNILQGLLK